MLLGNKVLCINILTCCVASKFWAAYQQEQYLAINFGLPSRQREAKTTVLYPAEVYDDDDITTGAIRHRPERGVSFIRGWNYCTDLYRLFENMDTQMRAWQETSEEEPGGTLNAFLARARQQSSTHHFAADLLHLIATLHRDLPAELKAVHKPMTGDPLADRHGFVAINILFTTNNLKILLVGAEEKNPNVHLRCAIAGELLDELGAVPVGWFHAASTGSLHHIAHVGHVLGSAIKDRAPLSSWSYLQVRNILLILVDFLEKLEASRGGVPPSPLAAKLQAQISRIDQCMQQTRQARAQLKSQGPDEGTGFVPLGQGVLTRMNSPPPGAMAHDQQQQQQLSPPHSASSIVSASMNNNNNNTAPVAAIPSAFSPSVTIPPSVLRLTRLLGVGVGDMGDDVPPPLGSGLPPDASAFSGNSNDFGFVDDNAFDMSSSQPTSVLQKSGGLGADLMFPPLSSAPLSADYFDGWRGML